MINPEAATSFTEGSVHGATTCILHGTLLTKFLLFMIRVPFFLLFGFNKEKGKRVPLSNLVDPKPL